MYSGDWDLQHAEVRYGGADSRYGSIYVNENLDTTDNGTSRLSDLLVADSANTGIDLVSGDSSLARINVVRSAGCFA